MSEEVKSCTCGCAEEPTEEELLERLDEVIAEYRGKPGALIPVLQIAQGIFGYLPEVALKRIARELRKSYSEVAGVVGFYSFFSTVPRGKHLVRVCLGTACYVRGGMQVLDALQEGAGHRRRRAPPRTASSRSRSRAASAPAAWPRSSRSTTTCTTASSPSASTRSSPSTPPEPVRRRERSA